MNLNFSLKGTYIALFFLCLRIGTATGLGVDSICVKVRIQINQQLTLERQGFQAEMVLTNPGITDLTNVSVALNFADQNSVPVAATSDPNNTSAKFFYTLTSSATLPDTVSAGTQGDFKWTIVPAISAGSSNPSGTTYLVGATLNYTLNGIATKIDVSPASIQVLPMPQLTLDYFLPADVYGDDPFTPQKEPSIPFSLGVRVKNTGFGDAKNLQIDSSQVKIVDNRQGLAVQFSILGSEVNGAAATGSLQPNFGTIPAGQSGTARWMMITSLYGRFTDFSAVFTHSDALGGALTSLISSVQTHELIHDVLVDLPGRDNIRDFLANDAGAIRVYESQNNDSTVTDLSGSAVVTGSGQSRAVKVPSSVGFSYIKVTDPFSGQKIVSTVTRADGKAINANNAWFSSTYQPNTQTWKYYLNIFDTNNTGGFAYNLGFTSATNHAPVVTPLPMLLVHTGETIHQLVKATDPDGDPLVLSAPSLPTGAAFVDAGNGTGTFSWLVGASQAGLFSVPFVASDGRLTDQKSAMIIVTSGSLTASWKDHYWPGISDPSIIGNTADPDHDGVPNLLEYALGHDPTQSDLLGMPIVGTTVVGGTTYLTLTYVGRSNDPALTLTVTGRGDFDSGAWQAMSDSVAADQSDVPFGFTRVTIRDNVPIAQPPQHRFLRLEVSTTDPN